MSAIKELHFKTPGAWERWLKEREAKKVVIESKASRPLPASSVEARRQ